jgi:hypothetical protein
MTVFYGNPALALFDFAPPAAGSPVPTPPANPAMYRLLTPHMLQPQGTRGFFYRERGEIITEFTDVPIGWVPTLAVEPLNAIAVTAYYNAGPRALAYEDVAQWANSLSTAFAPAIKPVTFWVKIGNQYQLTGLGAGLAPVFQ